MNRKAIIFGVKSLKLSKKEKIFFKKNKPWGIILFSRNINNIEQLKTLTNSIRNLFNDKKFPILIDQEGGRVSRLNKIIDLSFFTQLFFGKLYNKDKNFFNIFYKIYIDRVCEILKTAGININTVPVLDVFRSNSHKIIGDRSFSSNAKKVLLIGSKCIKLYSRNKIGTVIKHIPGHGKSFVDSHYDTPVISTSKRELIRKDFKPFKGSKSFFAMTAHAIYSSFDSKYTATHSKILINKVIRKYINFKGIIISDDISMKSLKYRLEENATKSLSAGCNLVLHCNAKLGEMNRLVKVIPTIDKFTKKKTSLFYKFLG